MLINRLQNHVFTYKGKEDFDKHYMDKSQVSAALGLLKKCLPDLANVELTGTGGQPFTIQIVGNLGKHNNDTKQLEAPPIPVQPLELPGGRG